ncbi:MAG: glycosyltransferase family 2 protein [Emcibacter sp.]|nr:glycosyltransferase family 2 protein [Emcibacter sp.]
MTNISSPSLDNIVVAIPCYNSQSTIGETIENTLEQTYGDFQIVVYDDGSTDASPDIVKSFEDRDSRVTLHRNEVNRGRPQARNALLGLASDGFIAWQDADDLWHPSKIAKQVSFYEEMYQKYGYDKIALVSSLDRRKPREGTDDDYYLSKILNQGYYGALHPPLEYDMNFVCSSKYMSFPFYLQSTFARASHFIEAGGFDNDIPWYEDLVMGMKLLGTGTKIFGLKSDVPLAYYFSGAPRLKPEIIISCLKRIYKNNAEALSECGIDIEYDLTLRKLTLLFLGMIRKREFSVALDVLAQDSSFVLKHSELEALLISNLGLLQKAINLAASIENETHSKAAPMLTSA